MVDIVQQVLVANMGAAGANTGGNVLGGGINTLTPEDASAIVMMAAFMSEMLAMVHESANGATMDAVAGASTCPSRDCSCASTQVSKDSTPQWATRPVPR